MVVAAFNIDMNKITAYINIGLVVLFIAFLIGIALAFLRGLRRGVWKSTHNMIFMFSLFVIAFATLDPFCKFVENFDISVFVKGSFVISTVAEGETMTYYVPLTSVKETVTGLLQGFYTIYNVSATASSASNFAFAIAESLIKIVLFVFDIIMILTFGNLFSFITWYAISQHFVPKVARKLVKLRWVSAAETAVTFVVTTALFCLPLTSLVNSLNQSYQRNRPKSDNEIIMNIGNFVDAYNNSLFAQILFNWTADENGMTFDTKLFNTFTTGISEDVAVGLVGELANWTNLVIVGANGITNSEDGQITFNAANLITQEIVDSAFSVLENSGLVTSILPIVVDIALNSTLLEGIIPSRLIDLSDVDWKKEITYLKDMTDCLFESGVLDKAKTANFTSNNNEEIFTFFENIVYDENFEKVLDIFKSIDESKVLSRAVPAAIYYLMNNDQSGKMKQYIPLSWEELNEFSWGYECYILFDFLHKTVTLDPQFLKAIMEKMGSYTPEEGEELKSLPTLISEHVDDFSALIVGDFDSSGNPTNIDKSGRTIVFNKGQRIEGRNYCLFDMMTIDKALPIVLNGLFELDFMKEYLSDVTEEDRNYFNEAIESFNVGNPLVNFKKEFHAILDIVGTVAKDTELLDALMGEGGFESLMTEPGNYFSIDQVHINYFKEAIEKMDSSKLIYSAVTPIIKSFLNKDEFTGFINDLGLRCDVVIDAINQDVKKENHEFFASFASLLDHWSDLGEVYNLTASGGDIMSAFQDPDLVDTLVDLLTILYENPMLNPTPEPGNTSYEKNENLYGLLEFVFSMTSSLGLEIDRPLMREVESVHSWPEEFQAIGEILKYIGTHDVLNAADLFSGGLTRDAILDLKDEGEGKIGLPALFALVDGSYLFKSCLGPFLDTMFGDILSGFLINEEGHVSFANIASWTDEGINIANLLESLYNIVPEDDAKAATFLSNFDLSTLHDIVELNNMLHQLAHSGIFTYIDEDGHSHYQFGSWFYQKINDAMVKFSVNSHDYDLLADPVPELDSTWSWKDSWGEKPGAGSNPDPYFVEYKNAYDPNGELTETHYIAYRDFVKLSGYENDDPLVVTAWCNYNVFTNRQNEFLTNYSNKINDTSSSYYSNDWQAYFASDEFMANYESVFEVDEISRVCKFMSYSLRVITECKTGAHAGEKVPFNELSPSFMDHLLTSANDTSCLRICIYNFYNVASENLINGYSDFDMSSAYNIYLIDGGYSDVFDFAHSRPARQNELDILVNLYDVIKEAESKHIIEGSSFVFSKLNEDGFLARLKDSFKDFSNSYVFHRSGASKANALTPLQNIFNSLLNTDSIKDTLYLGANSPKDANATMYDDATSKVRYLVSETFLDDAEIAARSLDLATQISKQEGEIDNLLDCIEVLYSLKDSGGNAINSITDADMNNSQNIDTLRNLFLNLNSSSLLGDCLPNSIYNIFNGDQFSVSSGTLEVNFKQVDAFYHYYFNGTVERSEPDYNAKYLNDDIDDIVNLLEDYQSLNEILETGDFSNPTTLSLLTSGGVLKNLLMDLHDANLFHTPARNYGGALYYTDKFDDGLTLFEEMMNKVCSFVMLDTFAYDATYDVPLGYNSASEKLNARIKLVTSADDGAATTLVYHNEEGTAWEDEVDAIMNLANVASSLTDSASLDVSSIELNKLSPQKIKEMLTAVNASELVCDAVPGFVSDGLEAINLGTLTTYDGNGINYAVYRLDQVTYGGATGLSPAGSEIDNIYNIMNVLYDEGTEQYASNMTDLTSFISGATGEAKLEGLLRFIYESHIFNTHQDGTYNAYNVIDGRNISAQGIMLYKCLGDNLCDFIARDADPSTAAKDELDKMATLSKILHMHNYEAIDIPTYHVEAKGLKKLVDTVGTSIDGSTFADNSIETIKAKKTLILSVVESSYNSDDEGHRSTIVSEFISGVFNNILENQYTKIDDNPATYVDYVYIPFSFGNDNAATLTLDDYSELSVIERDGLEGLLDALSYIGNPLSMKSNRAEIRACFVKMGANPGENSHIAQALYLTEAHKYLMQLRNPLILNSGEQFVPVNEKSCNPLEDNNIYSNTFSFKEYGERIETFLEGAYIPAL